MTDPTMPEDPPLEVLWALCPGGVKYCGHCPRGDDQCAALTTGAKRYQLVRAELVRQQEQNHAT